MQAIRVTVRPLGDAGVLIDLDVAPGPGTSSMLRALADRVVAATAGAAGWGAPVPGGASLFVPVDPLDPGAEAAGVRLTEIIEGWDGQPAAARASALALAPGEPPADDGPVLEIPTRYGGPGGPDLEAVAEATGLTPTEVVELHSAPTYTTLFLGFAPGFGYLGPLPAALSTARRPVPRTHVPAGSVAIAGVQTAIYPVDSPGGWWIIGRTAATIWDPRRGPPALLRPGLRVRFVPDRTGR